ncbi:glucose-6-phosphate dehydrogenase [Microbacterium thalassium]|uniref:Glucose-6-phosphate dehydrogenase n=1 Tax=Microbacterium thalassium TaxID=362649 RepID=A0A7X0FM63_9MICO|nr:glucose-6-phosphate dehydrogenase [Microbacterium thalassium]MBB6390058.1 hypothetical protein [Microbacterium thalassium]GLK25165.1 hypothetical protein GCM10017607_24840 [Microbacterium thalassium]
MKIVSSSDWRSSLPFETPTLLSEVMPGEDANCFICGTGADPRPRTELWAVKHRHPKNHDGYVRFYCLEHRPAVAAPPAPTVTAASTGRSRSASRPAAERRTAAPRRTPAPEKPRAVCPNCFVEVAASGVCGLCGEKIA